MGNYNSLIGHITSETGALTKECGNVGLLRGVREKEKSTKVNTKVGFRKSAIPVPGSSEMLYTWHLAHISRCFVLIAYTAELHPS